MRWCMRTTEHAVWCRAEQFLGMFPLGCPPLPSHPGVWVLPRGSTVALVPTLPEECCLTELSDGEQLIQYPHWEHSSRLMGALHTYSWCQPSLAVPQGQLGGSCVRG